MLKQQKPSQCFWLSHKCCICPAPGILLFSFIRITLHTFKKPHIVARQPHDWHAECFSSAPSDSWSISLSEVRARLKSSTNRCRMRVTLHIAVRPIGAQEISPRKKRKGFTLCGFRDDPIILLGCKATIPAICRFWKIHGWKERGRSFSFSGLKKCLQSCCWSTSFSMTPRSK